MRILFYGYEYLSLGSGTGNTMKNLFEGFSTYSDVQVDFITSSLTNQYEIASLYFERDEVGHFAVW